jgi:hypothetical protein
MGANKNQISPQDTEDTKKTLNKSADYTDYADFGLELRRAGRERKETAVLIMSSTRVTCESPGVIRVICEICGLYFCLRVLCASVVNFGFCSRQFASIRGSSLSSASICVHLRFVFLDENLDS